MKRQDMEMALIAMGRSMKTIVAAYAPNANHVSIDVINGAISVRACEWDGDKEDYINMDILNATQFADGTLLIDGQYIQKEDLA